MADVQKLAQELALIEARRKQIRGLLLKAWDELGTFEAAGYHVAKIQSITPEVYNPIAVAYSIPRLINDDQISEYFGYLLNRIQTNRLNGAVDSLPIAAELKSLISNYDEDGGLMEVIGKPRKVIVTYEPATGKREGTQHVLEPGDTPLAATVADVDEVEGEEMADGLSAGN